MSSPEQETSGDNRSTDTSQPSSTRDSANKSAGDAIKDVKASGKEKVEHARGEAADTVDSLAKSAHAAASKLEGDGLEKQFSQQLDKLAEGMGTLSQALRDKSGDEILRDVRRIAREHPALFLTGSVVLGLAASRFAGASSKSSGTGRSGDSGKSTGDGGNTAKGATASSNSDSGETTKSYGTSGKRPPDTMAATVRPAASSESHSSAGSDTKEKHP